MTATDLTIAKPPVAGVKPEILSECLLSEGLAEYFSTAKALSSLKAKGLLSEVPTAAVAARAMLVPVTPSRLTDRLTALGMMMAPNRSPQDAAIWLGEMTRLLGDIPEDVLSDAIDTLVQTLKFLPTCAEIREKAEETMQRRRRAASQLEAMVRYMDSGQPIPEQRREEPRSDGDDKPMTAEEAEELNAIMSKLGATTRWKPDGRSYQTDGAATLRANRGPPRKPTSADYIAMGVDPAHLDDPTTQGAA